MESLDAYIRVSRVGGREGPGYISPSVQREQIQRWADYKNVQISSWHVDEDQSGGQASRPGLDAAVQRCLDGLTGGIVSARIDRFSRLTEQGIRDLRRLSEVGARLAFVQEDLDLSGPMGRFFYVLMLAMSELFLDQIKASWVVAKTRAIRRGAHIGPTPLGYRRQNDGTLAPSDDAAIVSETFRLAATGNLDGACRHLQSRLEGRWESSQVRRLLANRVYLGEVRYGELVQPNAHEPLVGLAIWEAAQTVPTARRANERFPLSGILSCGTCGAPMVGGRGGTGQRTYRCSQTLSTATGGRCTAGPVITASLVEDHVRAHVLELLEGFTATVSEPDSDRLALLERAMNEAEMELDAFAGDLTMRRVLAGRYHAHLETRAVEVERARERYREAARAAVPAVVLTAEAALDDLGLVLRSMFDRIVVARGRGRVGDRVRFVPLDVDGLTGIASAEDGE